MDIFLAFFWGICFKPHANLISIKGNIKELKGFDKNPRFLILYNHVILRHAYVSSEGSGKSTQMQMCRLARTFTACILTLVESQPKNRNDCNSFFDLFSDYQKTYDYLNLKFLRFCRHTVSLMI